MIAPYPVNREWGLFSGNVAMPEATREGAGLYAR